MNTYTQCEIRKGDSFGVAWLPSQYAIKGKVLRLKFRGNWEDGWIVKHIYDTYPEDRVHFISDARRELSHKLQ